MFHYFWRRPLDRSFITSKLVKHVDQNGDVFWTPTAMTPEEIAARDEGRPVQNATVQNVPNPAVKVLPLPAMTFNEGEAAPATDQPARDEHGNKILDREPMKFEPEKPKAPRPAPTVAQVLDLPKMQF
jgi:hypothetical protein